MNEKNNLFDMCFSYNYIIIVILIYVLFLLLVKIIIYIDFENDFTLSPTTIKKSFTSIG